MNYYLKDGQVIGASGFTPENAIPLPEEMKAERGEWLTVEEVTDEAGFVTKQVKVNEAARTAIKAQEESKKQEEAQLKESLESNKRASEARLKALEKSNPALFTAVQDMMFLLTGNLLLPDAEDVGIGDQKGP